MQKPKIREQFENNLWANVSNGKKYDKNYEQKPQMRKYCGYKNVSKSLKWDKNARKTCEQMLRPQQQKARLWQGRSWLPAWKKVWLCDCLAGWVLEHCYHQCHHNHLIERACQSARARSIAWTCASREVGAGKVGSGRNPSGSRSSSTRQSFRPSSWESQGSWNLA